MEDSKTKEHQLWGGRFRQPLDPTMDRFNRSLGFDVRLFDADRRSSMAYSQALREAGVLTETEADQISLVLRKMKLEELLPSSAEDVHTLIEQALIKKLGPVAKKLHAGRSRNDQVATALRLWLIAEIDETRAALSKVQEQLILQAEKYAGAVMPGYTHLQPAQPVLMAHWCLAYFEMLRRDDERLWESRKRTNIMPLGSGALAGTSYAIDRDKLARRLKFSGICRNSLDGVSDRDFAVEFLSAAALTMVHLSRLSEDLILYCSREFGFVELSDAVSTGSSLLPQKKNPDAMELIRGKTGRTIGTLTGLLCTIKGLPLAYNKDLQEDKEAVFDGADTLRGSLLVTNVVLANIRWNRERMAAASTEGFLNAADAADYLVRKGVPFRKAHESVGNWVVAAINKGVELSDLSLAELKAEFEGVEDDFYQVLTIEKTLQSKNAPGGTSPQRVGEALIEARQYLGAKGVRDEPSPQESFPTDWL